MTAGRGGDFGLEDCRGQPGAPALCRDENIGAPAVTAIFDLVYSFLERRYARFATILAPGRLREEVLANVARQLAELSIYFASFTRSLADRCF